jgi:hypothetical protein
MKHEYNETTLQAAVDASFEALPLLSFHQASARLSLARALLDRLPEPQPVVSLVQFTDAELTAIKELMESQSLSSTQVLRQALRCYQMAIQGKPEPTPEPEQPWTPAVGDADEPNPAQDMALGGQMYWRDLARQLAEVWWKCHSIGASLQHGDIDTDVSFSICCEQHGGQCFHADTPHNAWLKAEKWLMSPDRANFPAAACLTPAKEAQP